MLKTSESGPAPRGDIRGNFWKLFGIGTQGRSGGELPGPEVVEPPTGRPAQPRSRLSAVSQDIRTPLHALKGMAEMLAAGEPSARRRRMADVIARSASSLLWTISDGLDTTGADAAVELEAGAVDLCEIADDVLALFWEPARAKGLDLAAFVDPETPKLIEGDALRLRQVLSNLVNNAVQATDTGGVLVQIAPRGDGLVRIGVHDTSDGASEGRGGIGMAICSRVVEAMGGVLKVITREGRGCAFAFDLPIRALEASAPWPKAGGDAACAVALAGASTRSALGRYLAAAGVGVTALDADDAAFVIADPTALANRDRAAAPTVCLREMGDGAPGEVIGAGLADLALTQPLRRCELEAVLRRALAGEPLAGAVGEDDADAGQNLPRFTGRRILIADDNALAREMLTEALAGLGVAPAVTTDGRQVVQAALAGAPFDVILMDAAMPGMDGYEAAREIRRREADEGRARTPIIALAPQAAGAAETAWSDADMDAVVHTPFSRASLAAAVVQFVEPAAEPRADSAPKPVAAGQSTPGIPTSELLDPQVGVELARLAAAGKADFVDRVRRLYRENAPLAVKAVIDAAVARDPEATVRSAHALKSMSLNMGARLVAETASRIESQARDMGVVNVDQTQVLHRQLLATLDVLDGYPPTVGQTTAAPAADAEERALLSDLGEAIGKSELSLVYQPQFDRDGHSITGVETLLRWNHPVRGFVSPALFIPLAERHGLIGPITQWVLDRAMSETEDLGLTISFNASAMEFADPCFVDELSVMIARRRFDPRRLEIEVTETAVLAEEDEVRRNMARLHEIGLKIALDDFGVGYSSLSHLRLFPFDKLKIDRAFVTGCAENVQSATLVHAVVAIGRSLGMQVVAEGVETEAQRTFLKAAGVHAMQGYFFAKPEPIAALRARLGLEDAAAQTA